MNIQERKNRFGEITSYRIRVFDHRDAVTGKQVFYSCSVRFAKDKSEEWNRNNAFKQAVLFEKKVRENGGVCSSLNFSNYCSYAIKTKQSFGLSQSTVYIYNNALKRISPYLGHIRLSSLSPYIINNAYRRMEQDGISKSTIYQFHLFIHSMLAMAFREGLIPRNFADAAVPPKRPSGGARSLTEDEISDFFTALYRDEGSYLYKVLFSLLLISGCRIGELCALKWNDIDLEKGVIHICRHFQQSSCGLKLQDGGKTDASDRFICLDGAALEMLTDYKAYWLKSIESFGSLRDDCGAVFFSSRKHGAHLNPSSVRNWLNSFTDSHGLARMHPHLFRHTVVSIQLASGISVAEAAKRAGHSRSDVTLRIYTHVVRNNDAHLSEVISDALPPLPKYSKS